LTAHAALYRSFRPGDGVHSYFGWYEPAVAVLSAASALVVVAAAVAAMLGRRSRTLAALRATPPTVRSAVRLAAFAIGWLVVQETIERSVGAGAFEPATFGAARWSIIVGATAIAAGALTLLARVSVALVVALVATTPKRVARLRGVARLTVSVPPRKRRALADRRGLRAPPATV
jgi:hypothetical protein